MFLFFLHPFFVQNGLKYMLYNIYLMFSNNYKY